MSYASDCSDGLNCIRPGCLQLHKPRHRAHCTTCFDTGLVDWAPGQHRDSDQDQQPCPDCDQEPRYRPGITSGPTDA